MSLFKQLFGRKPATTEKEAPLSLKPPRPGRPTYVDAVRGKVAVDFYAHESADGALGNFLTAVTKGLAASGQRELALTLRLSEGEDTSARMRDIVRFIATVHAWARQGNLVDDGALTQFGERGLFGRAHSGLLYTDARPIADVPLPDGALAAVVVDALEVRAAVDFGAYRVLTRLGVQLRLFPFPTWGELDRPSVVTPREAESLLAKIPRMRAPGVSFVVADKTLRITIPPVTKMLKGLSSLLSGAPFALLLRPAPSANAVLVWNPGQQEMTGISPAGSDGSHLSGSVLMIAPGAETDHARPFEDGYSLFLSHASWASLTAALSARQAFALPLPDGMRVEVQWAENKG